MTKPRSYDYIVDADWLGDEGLVCFKGWTVVKMFSTVQGAIDEVEMHGLKDAHIKIEPGTYFENCTFNNGIHLDGEVT